MNVSQTEILTMKGLSPRMRTLLWILICACDDSGNWKMTLQELMEAFYKLYPVFDRTLKRLVKKGYVSYSSTTQPTPTLKLQKLKPRDSKPAEAIQPAMDTRMADAEENDETPDQPEAPKDGE